jgi:predicted amidohydrolase YtcJ
MKTMLMAAGTLAISLAAAWPTAGAAGDLALLNGRIYTADPDVGVVKALLIIDGRVALSGDSAAVLAETPAGARVINLDGGFAMPGFNDAHLHLGNAVLQSMNLDLTGVGSLQALQEKLADHAEGRSPGEWIYGRGWDESLWLAAEIPTAADLDAATDRHPVYLERADGHSAVVNSLALEAADIDARTPDPDGGVIVRDDDGVATGWLKEHAQLLVERLIPPPSPAQIRLGLERAFADALAHGVTSVQDDSLRLGAHGRATVDVLAEMAAAGELPLRISTWLPFEAPIPELVALRERLGSDDPWFRAGLLKTNIDGSGGSLSAAMLADYETAPGNRGLLLMDEETLTRMVIERDAAGFQLGIHSIGDRANRVILDAYAAAIEENGERDSRHRVEHAQFVADEDVPRFARLGVIASMQPCHLLTDMRWAPAILGPEREREGYRWRSLLEAGARLAFGTDYPVEPIDPFRGLYASVTREFPTGGPEGGWIPEEKIDVLAAIDAYTRDAAYAEFEDHRKGTLATGMLGDVVVLSRDPREAAPRALLETRVRYTIVDGRVLYERPSAIARRGS